MAQALNVDIGPVRRLYHELYGSVPSFYRTLKRLNTSQGLRLWTAFSIACDERNAGGDLLRMQYNAEWLEKDAHLSVRTVFMDDWIKSTQAEFSGLHSFLGGSHIRTIPDDIHAIDDTHEVKAADVFFPHSETKGVRWSKGHITQNLVSHETKEQWIKDLRSDPVLGRFLTWSMK
jgi:hypothetical protein